MAADCSFFLSSTAFTTVCAPLFSADVSALLITPLVNGFHDWFSRRIALWMAAYCSFFHSSTAFTTVCAPCCPVDGGGLLIRSLVNGFHNGLRAVVLRRLPRIAHTSACQRLSQRFARRIAQRMTGDCSLFRSSKPFVTYCAPYCSSEGSALLILQFVEGFHGLRAILLSGLHRTADTSARQRLSQQFVRRIALRMAADCSFLRSSTGFTTICTLYCLVNGTADGITAR